MSKLMLSPLLCELAVADDLGDKHVRGRLYGWPVGDRPAVEVDVVVATEGRGLAAEHKRVEAKLHRPAGEVDVHQLDALAVRAEDTRAHACVSRADAADILDVHRLEVGRAL